MATGPEHYREAERLLAYVDSRHPKADESQYIAAAKVHALLALAAAQVEDMESGELRPGWAEIVDGDAS